MTDDKDIDKLNCPPYDIFQNKILDFPKICTGSILSWAHRY